MVESCRDYSKLSDKEWKKIEPPMLPPRDVGAQIKVMEETHEILADYGLTHWLVDGALIHIVRDKELKSYNQDIDFACYSEEIVPVIRIVKKSFIKSGYAVRAYKHSSRLNVYKHGEMASIQGYNLKGKYRWLKNHKIPARYFTNSETIVFNGVEYMTPSINKYLSWKYSNWKKPYTGNTKNKKYLNKRRLVGHV